MKAIIDRLASGRSLLVGGLVLFGVGCAGPAGTPGAACAILETDGVKTLSCPDGTTATIGSGAPGVDGADTLVTITAVSASADGDCAAGGVRIDSGRDNGPGALAGNGVLDPEEITSSRTVCNGLAGADSGPATLVATRDEPPGEHCFNGGIRIDSGSDESGDGALQDEEIASTQYACNGAEGQQGATGETGETGAPGQPGQTGPEGPQGPAGESVATSSEPEGEHCAAGGVKLVSTSGTTYVCNGAAGAVGQTGPQGLQGESGPQGPAGESVVASSEPEGEHCAAGGVKLVSTSDTTYVCNGPAGTVGPTGPQGPQGIQGLNGDTGPQGPQGQQGLQGLKGDTGPQGLQGLNGNTGPQGEQGLQGLQGLKGDTGAQGAQGIQGFKGDTGAQGPQGLQGPQGIQGPAGPAPGTFNLCGGGGVVRTDGSSAFPCAVVAKPTLYTYVCPMNVPAPATVTSSKAFGIKYGSTGYLEASAYGLANASFAPVCWSSNTCVWQNSKAAPDGNVTLTLHSGSYAVDSNTRYLLSFALTAPVGETILMYGFQVQYTQGGTNYTLNVSANGCTLQN